MNKIYTETFGAGKPIVLVHGWAMHSGIWRSFAQDLAKCYRVTIVDLPGHGKSGVILPFTLEKISEALVNAVEDVPSCWLGWSFGAEVVLKIADHFPARVEKLMLLTGSPCFINKADWPGMAEPVLDSFAASLLEDAQATLLRFLSLQVNGLENSKEILQQLKHAVFESQAPNSSVLQDGLQILKQSDLRQVFARLSIPISVILGGKDTLVPITVAEKMLELRPYLPLTKIDRAGHVPFLSDREFLVEIIRNFMDD